MTKKKKKLNNDDFIAKRFGKFRKRTKAEKKADAEAYFIKYQKELIHNCKGFTEADTSEWGPDSTAKKSVLL